MTETADDQLKQHHNDFTNACKKITIFVTDKNRTLPTDVNKLTKYKTDVIEAYNNLARFVAIIFDSQTQQQKERLESLFEKVLKVKLCEALQVLSLKINLPENFLEIDIKTVQPLSNVTQTNQTQSTASVSNNLNTQIQGTIPIQTNPVQTSTVTTQITIPAKMPQTRAEFLKEAGSVINYKFDGNPLKLESFLADVDMVEAIAEAEQRAFCLTFIKAKLDQKALECLPETVNTVKDITDALRANIKPESSDVVEGKLLALRLKMGDFTEFTKKAEQLTESFRRSLVIEGITRAKADEMTIKKTIELCRRSTNIETVKSIVSSTKYEKPAEVLATFVTQSDIAKKEKREKDLRQNFQQNKNTTNFRGKNNNVQRGGFNKNPNPNFQDRDNRGQRDNRGRFQSNRGNNRGGGFQRGNYRNNYPPPQSEQAIRYVTAQQPMQQPFVAQQAPNESLSQQFFRIGP